MMVDEIGSMCILPLNVTYLQIILIIVKKEATKATSTYSNSAFTGGGGCLSSQLQEERELRG